MNKLAIMNLGQKSTVSWKKCLAFSYELFVFHTMDQCEEAFNSGNLFDLICVETASPSVSVFALIELGNRLERPMIIAVPHGIVDVPVDRFIPGELEIVDTGIDNTVLKQKIRMHLELFSARQVIQQTQIELEYSERMAALGQISAGIAHEINNPIGFVSANVSLFSKYFNKMEEQLTQLENACRDDTSGQALSIYTGWKSQGQFFRNLTEMKEMVEESEEGLERVRSIVKDLKTFAYEGESLYQAADVNDMLRSTLNLLRNEIKYKAEVVTEFGSLPSIQCVVSQLNQVFVNIIVNACHAIEDFGFIQISTVAEGGGSIVVQIRDSGKGIPDDLQSRIFEPFFTTKPVGKGTGIGLAISKSIIERHHGTIRVKSEVGKGALFEIRLPVDQVNEP